ncbi:excalibur calcium-binding domain-containing protein [Sphingobium yanoikuyae]|uniref:Excalibur calcium-binding domain-containing protein n=1 Tax=Sphingobium yanoikuyae TaxID=13690 RepID=A0AA42X266_SPHYA|nr:excalibur calcium-binding domain-containing protein [Sphingobium yanoikuyae]MDH2134616.1 excalibur calcium-binding domain-containing protein [Sphingobium yanoikuyae]MDH2152184.1 excalibur calcium-binding domain-containing protein [Sphingobium yanoikuyae]MDH2170046.1 excalibur calcium-binding domain-containing protein [Sphingobium yanoikuyae]
MRQKSSLIIGALVIGAAGGVVLRDPTPAARSEAPFWSYRNCSEARAAGDAQLHRDQPGCGAHLDRDGDGVACEPYTGR